MIKFATILAIIFVAVPSDAYYGYRLKIPNGERVPNPCNSNEFWIGLGHENPRGGGARNSFGEDFKKAGAMWTEELCKQDSDGDGKSNGEELGDPMCSWREGQTPQITNGLSHPGVCDPFDKAECDGKNDFVECAKKSFNDSCDVINNADVKSVDFRFEKVNIPNTETNYYCQYFDLPQDQDYHIVADEGIIDNVETVHHMIVYACPDNFKGFPGMDKPGPCSMSGRSDSCYTIMSLWTVGIDGSCFGAQRGFKIGTSGYKKIKLEIHYNNPDLVDGYTDTSGMRIYYQPMKPGVENLATFSVGQTYLQIPPGEDYTEFSGSCEGSCSRYIISKQMYVISAINHMHYLGRMQRTEVLRDGKVIKVLAHDDPYDYDSPIVHEHEEPFAIMPGDEIKTTCGFNSMSQKKITYYGEGTSDEMCFSFLTVYPEDALSNTKWCISHGPIGTCELYSRTPKYDCDWSYFTNISNTEMLKTFTALKENCLLDGKCRRGCKEITERVLEHPCMGKEMNQIVSSFLSTYPEGVEMLAYIRSCQGESEEPEDRECKREDCWHTCGDGDSDGEGISAGNARAVAPVAMLMTLIVAMVTYHMF